MFGEGCSLTHYLTFKLHSWSRLTFFYLQAAKVDPNCMATRFAVAVQRIKDAERSQDASDQLSWAGNEMASVIREGESVPIDPPIAWAGLAMAHKAQHEIAAAFVADRNELTEMEERATYSLKQV